MRPTVSTLTTTMAMPSLIIAPAKASAKAAIQMMLFSFVATQARPASRSSCR
jgi:hypothetical protein